MQKIAALIIFTFLFPTLGTGQELNLASNSFELPEIEEVSEIRSGSTGVLSNSKEWNVEFQVARENRFESSVGTGGLDSQIGTRLALGFKTKSWLMELEYGEFESNSKAGTLEIDWQRSETLLLASYLARDYGWWTPVFGVGAGAYRERVDSNLSGVGSVDSNSDLLAMGVANAGFRFQINMFKLTTRAQLVKRETEKQLEYSWLAGIGVSL